MTATRFYRPELDLLRFACFLLVFLHHSLSRAGESLGSALVDACGFGVPVFFLLSSFLITELLLREIDRTGRVHVRSFYARRMLRIWPLYFGFIAFCWLATKTHLVQPLPAAMALSFLLMAGNWYFVRFGSSLNPAGVLWSVSVEEQFYLVWPWLMRRGDTRRLLLTSLAMLALSYTALAFLAAHGSPADPALWGNTLVQMQFFALGSLLAAFLHRRESLRLPAPLRPVLLFAAASSWTAATALCRIKRFDPAITPAHACLGYALVALGAVALFLAFYRLQLAANPVTRPLAYLGRISYGLYVFHIFSINAAGAMLRGLHHRPHQGSPAMLTLSLALTIAAAAFSYQFYERPFVRWKERFTLVPSRTAEPASLIDFPALEPGALG